MNRWKATDSKRKIYSNILENRVPGGASSGARFLYPERDENVENGNFSVLKFPEKNMKRLTKQTISAIMIFV